jgi:hypothetical protein
LWLILKEIILANTTFVNQSTVIVAEWLNDVNEVVYVVLGDGTNVPTTPAQVRDNLGLEIGTDIPGPTGTGASGTWGINITGNAATATSVSGVQGIANGGTGQTTAANAFDALKQAATETATGVVELATSAEVAAGTDTTRAITPAALRAGPLQSFVRVISANGYGSTNTVIRRFTTLQDNVGSDITYADSATNGATFTINNTGVYAVSYNDSFNAAANFGLSLNSAQLTTAILSITAANRITNSTGPAANQSGLVSLVRPFTAGDVIRAHTDGTATGATNVTQLTITRIA